MCVFVCVIVFLYQVVGVCLCSCWLASAVVIKFKFVRSLLCWTSGWRVVVVVVVADNIISVVNNIHNTHVERMCSYVCRLVLSREAATTGFFYG